MPSGRGRSSLVRQAVAMPEWKLGGGGSYVVTGVPVLAGDLTSVLTSSILRLLLVAVGVMALVLALLFRSRLRLLPLLLAGASVAIVFGILSVLGLPLTMASIAVLPILLGLCVDYGIQFQSASRSALVTAALATGVGFLTLLLSPVPMVRGFGALLILGVAVGLLVALTAGTAVLTLAGRRRASDGPLARSLRGAGDLVDGVRGFAARVLAPARWAGRGVLRTAVRHPRELLAAGAILATLGWVLDSRIAIVSELQKLVPQSLGAVRDLNSLQKDTGVAGEVDVLVQGRDLTDPKVIAWMRDYQNEVLLRHGYNAAKGCTGAALCPALSLPDLFRTPQLAATQAQIRALLDAVPPYFSQAAITPDRKTAVLAFGLRLQSLAGQRDVMQDMRARLHSSQPPPGLKVTLSGLPVLVADANHAMSDPFRRLLTALLGLALVALALFAVYRSWERAWVPSGADRAGDGLVLAGVVARRRAAEPDVGGAERAGDRDLDGVLRAVVRALPGGAGGRVRGF